MLRAFLVVMLLASFAIAQEQPAPAKPAAPDQQQQTADDQDEKPTKPKPGFKDLKRHFSSWCVGSPVSRCFEKKEDADEAQKQASKPKSKVPESQAPPRSDQPDTPAGESSSRQSQIDLSPPPDDNAHPGAEPEDVSEFHPYDPHKAAKNVEVGDFYFDQRNYFAAHSRYQEALLYKPNDANATFRLAESAEKMGKLDEARDNYAKYLKILPHGPLADAATKALERLKANAVAPTAQNPTH